MARRQVKCTTKNSSHVITHIGGDGPFYETASDAIWHIENGIHNYYTYVNGKEAKIDVVPRNGTKYLRTFLDGTETNNLDELSEC